MVAVGPGQRSRIARAVGEEDPVGFQRQDVGGRGTGRHHGDRAQSGQLAHHGRLDTEVEGDDAQRAPSRRWPSPPWSRPRPGPSRRCWRRPRRRRGVRASGAVPKAQGTAPARRRWRVRRRVSTPVMAGTPWRARKASRPSVDLQFEGSVVRSRTTIPRQCGSAGLIVLAVGAVVADVGTGEGHDLPGIRGIGDDLLVAAHGGVEHQLAGGDRTARRRPLRPRRPRRRPSPGGRLVGAGPIIGAPHRWATASITTGSPRSTVWRTAPVNVRPA